jgi:hypothetical protein
VTQEPTTLAARVRSRFAGHEAGALVLLVVAVLAGIGGAIGGFKEIAKIVDPEDPPPVHFSADDLRTVNSPRYKFAFSYPSDWERRDSENSDGPIIDAGEDGVEMRSFGRLALSYGPPPSRERLDFLVQQEQDNGAKIVKGPVLQQVPGIGPLAETDIQGYRVVARLPATGGRPALTKVFIVTTLGERDVELDCQVPTDRFSRWERACTQLVNSLTLTG